MASVEDLIATISGAHVGQEGYDLQSLQAHLTKTLAYNSRIQTYPSYHPVPINSHIPPAPVSSLNSMASTSYHNVPIQHAFQQGTRPQCTPANSFRGFLPPTDDDDDDDMDTENEAGPSRHGGGGGGQDTGGQGGQMDTTEYGGFEGDAFAPLYTTSQPLNSPYSPPRFQHDALHGSGSPEGLQQGPPKNHWDAFRKPATRDGWGQSTWGGETIPEERQQSGRVQGQGGMGMGGEGGGLGVATGLPTPPEDNGNPTWQGRLRSSNR